MRKFNKVQCAEMVNTLEEAHAEIINYISKSDGKNAAMLLEQCQQAAIAIGGIVESSDKEGGLEAVRKLEAYCEQVYKIHESLVNGEEVNTSKTEKQLHRSALGILNEINALPTRLEAVFLPYKASMWDSLESIWMAADADETCDTYVIPIPYYDKNPDGSFGQVHYERELYPDYVPTVDFGDFDFGEHRPDMIFIHNPYDEYNHVTSVHPFFYSSNLKKFTDCLVYVPYYATSGAMSESQALCMAYVHSDYIVVQSKEIIEQFDPRVPRVKFLPYGSPKYDRVIRMSNKPPELPEEWADKIRGRKVFFYNTSINGMLHDTGSFLKKMRYVFETFKENPEVCILWRPHPLLESTFESLRRGYLEEYLELKRYFAEKDIGILDETPDIDTAISLSDAYIGDSGTSVISLFGVAGKEIYIFNNNLHEAPAEDDWKAWVCGAVRGDRNDRYCLALGNRLFESKDWDGHYRFVRDLSDEYLGGGYYSVALEAEGKIIVFPANAEEILILDPKDYSKRTVSLKHEVGRGGAFAGAANLIFSEHPEVFYILPNRYPALVRFDAKSEKVDYINDEAFSDEFSIYLNEDQNRILAPRFFGDDEGYYAITDETKDFLNVLDDKPTAELKAADGSVHKMYHSIGAKIPGITMRGPRLICIDQTGRRLRAVQLETGETQEREIDLNGIYPTGFIDGANPDVFWFSPYEGTELTKWTMSEDKWEKVDAAVEGLVSIRRPQRVSCNINYFSNGIFHNGRLILAPNWGNKFVEIDTHTNEAKEWIPPFAFSTEDISDYKKNWGIGYFYRDSYDFSCKFFYTPEHIIYELDLDTGEVKGREFIFDKEEIYSLSRGFHMESQWLPYCCYEDVFNPLGELIRGRVCGSAFDKTAQLKAYRSINASPDGDCGEKVYERLKRGMG